MKTLRENFKGASMVETDWVRSILAQVPAVIWEGSRLIGQPCFAMEFVSDYAETLLGYPARRWIEEPDFWLDIPTVGTRRPRRPKMLVRTPFDRGSNSAGETQKANTLGGR